MAMLQILAASSLMGTTAEERWDKSSECKFMYPKLVKDVGQVRLAIMQWEEKWKVMMSELGEGAKIPDLWRKSALLEMLEICS